MQDNYYNLTAEEIFAENDRKRKKVRPRDVFFTIGTLICVAAMSLLNVYALFKTFGGNLAIIRIIYVAAFIGLQTILSFWVRKPGAIIKPRAVICAIAAAIAVFGLLVKNSSETGLLKVLLLVAAVMLSAVWLCSVSGREMPVTDSGFAIRFFTLLKSALIGVKSLFLKIFFAKRGFWITVLRVFFVLLAAATAVAWTYS